MRDLAERDPDDDLADAIALAADAVTRSGNAIVAHIDAATAALPDPCPVCHQRPCDAVTDPAYLATR